MFNCPLPVGEHVAPTILFSHPRQALSFCAAMRNMSNMGWGDIIMKKIHSPALDLNLIKMFDAMMEARSVSRAAEILGVSQSAVSHSLARLRVMLGDPLFVRTGNRMEPTARAQRLAEPVRDLLLGAARTLAVEEEFDPTREARTFTIAAIDSLQALLLTGLLKEAHTLRIGLLVKSLEPEATLVAVDKGDVDLAIGVFPSIRRWHEKQALYREKHVCLFDPRQVTLTTPISIADYVRYPHLIPSLGGGLSSFVDELLAKAGVQRQVIAGTTQFLAIPFMLAQAPLIATMPERIAQFCVQTMGLASSPVPYQTKDAEISMLWHRRNSSSPAHTWLRERIAVTAAHPPIQL